MVVAMALDRSLCCSNCAFADVASPQASAVASDKPARRWIFDMELLPVVESCRSAAAWHHNRPYDAVLSRDRWMHRRCGPARRVARGLPDKAGIPSVSPLHFAGVREIFTPLLRCSERCATGVGPVVRPI